MSLPSPEQNQNKSDSGREPEYDNEGSRPQRAFAEAEATQGTPLSIIPVAPLHWRLLAFVLDWTLISLFAALLLTKVLLPEYHPVGYSQYMAAVEEFAISVNQALDSNDTPPSLLAFVLGLAQKSEEIRAMFVYMTEIFALCAIVYFILCERLMAGGSIGKSMLRLRVISLNTGRPPNIWESALRGLIKVCPLINLLFIISYLFAFFNKLRRTGHDMLSRTLVVSDTGGIVPQARKRRDEDEDDDDDY